jgi:hypothetical protein
MVMSFNLMGLTLFLRNFMRATLKLNRGGAIVTMAPLCQLRYERIRKNSSYLLFGFLQTPVIASETGLVVSGLAPRWVAKPP